MAAWLAGCAVAAAQDPHPAPLARGDVHFVMGWQNLHQAQSPSSDDWINDIFYGGLGAGWYWTDHLKTQVDFGGGTRGQQYRYDPSFATSGQSGGFSRLSVNQSSLAISQQYQFFRNQWFHPHVAGGVDIARQTTTEQYDPIFVFDPVARTSRQISPARVEGPDHHIIATPFVETGFKAYMNRRAFFTSDMRLMARHGIDQVLFRLGFGIDF
jgi:outer membrane protein with beta-barrel domain